MSHEMKKNAPNIEQILRDASFSNPEHKEALRGRLFDAKHELEMEDLALVAAGTGGNILSDETKKPDDILGWELYDDHFGTLGKRI